MMNDDDKCRYLNYRASFFSAAAIFVMSLFSQWFLWFMYEKSGYKTLYPFIAPLVLCMMYHFVQLDAGKRESFSRRFFFVFAVALPLVFSIVITVIMKISSPELYLFSPEAEYHSGIREKIAVFAGRSAFSSVYLLIFAIIDIPLLKRWEQKEKDK